MSVTTGVIVAGAVFFGIYLLGRMTPEARLRRPIIDTSTVPDWAKVLMFVVAVCALIIWLAGS